VEFSQQPDGNACAAEFGGSPDGCANRAISSRNGIAARKAIPLQTVTHERKKKGIPPVIESSYFLFLLRCACGDQCSRLKLMCSCTQLEKQVRVGDINATLVFPMA
jgi:hypothetical protein